MNRKTASSRIRATVTLALCSLALASLLVGCSPAATDPQSVGGDADLVSLVEEQDAWCLETPYYTLTVPAGELEDGWTYRYTDEVTGDASSGQGGHRLEVFATGSDGEPYLTVVQCTAGWAGLQSDQGARPMSIAYSSMGDDGAIWWTSVLGEPYGDQDSAGADESLAFTEKWASNVAQR